MKPCETNPEMWFSEEIFDVKAAKKICNRDCPLGSRTECLALGLGEDFGVWGGLSTYERTRLRRGAA